MGEQAEGVLHLCIPTLFKTMIELDIGNDVSLWKTVHSFPYPNPNESVMNEKEKCVLLDNDLHDHP